MEARTEHSKQPVLITYSTEKIKEMLESRCFVRKESKIGSKCITYQRPGCHDIKIVERWGEGHMFKVNGWMFHKVKDALKRSVEQA